MLTPFKRFFLFCLFSLLFSIGVSAQIIVPTYYVIPPVNGCDGVWAISDTAYGCDGSVPNDTTPSGGPCCDMNNWVFSGDTIFIPLCSLPCSIIFYNAIGGPDCGWAQTPTILNTTAVADDENYYGFPSLLKAGGFYTVHFKSCEAEQLQVFDIRGSKMNAAIIATENDNLQVHCENFSPGIYIVRDSKGIFPVQRFAIVR